MKTYKIREYYKTGTNKGNLKQELFFDTIDEVNEYYNAVFDYHAYSLNPTVWRWDKESSDYIRVPNY